MTAKQRKELIINELLDISKQLDELVIRNSMDAEDLAKQLKECARALDTLWETE